MPGGIDIILGAVLVGRSVGRPRDLPVNYFAAQRVVKIGLLQLGKADNLKSALAVVRAKYGDRFRRNMRL